jgi:hypothetical protein
MATPPDFTAGQVLTAAQMNAVGLWLVKTQTVGSAVSSVTVTNAFNADYVNYKIFYTGGVGSATNSLAVQLAPTSVANYNTGYYLGNVAARYSDGFVGGSNVNNGTSWSPVGTTNTSNIAMSIELLSPQAASRTAITVFGISMITSDFGGAGAGYHNHTNQYTGFTITPAAGTITGGTIYVYGYNI